MDSEAESSDVVSDSVEVNVSCLLLAITCAHIHITRLATLECLFLVLLYMKLKD